MPCARPEESLSWSALGPDEQEMSCPASLAGVQQQVTARISTVDRLGQWIRGKVRENRLYQLARRQGLRLSKCRRRDPRASGSICYGLEARDQAGCSVLPKECRSTRLRSTLFTG
jgi:hypothetical protein